MGAINNAFNQAAGAVAGAALAYKHAKETDFSKMNVAENTALVARNQARAAETEADKADAELWSTDEKGKFKSPTQRSAEANKTVDEAKAAYYKAKERKNASSKTVQKKFNDLAAAISARNALNTKINAINAMSERAFEQRAAADRATKLAEKAQQKYQSRWGGIR